MKKRPKFQDWPKEAVGLSPPEIVRMYKEGFAGAKDNPEAREGLRDWIKSSGGGYVHASDVAHAFKFADVGAGQLLMPFLFLMDAYPTALPSTAQGRGSCVAHDTMQTCLMTLVCEVARGVPDEQTGIIEGLPEVSAEAEDAGVLSTEAIYWWRRHAGDGWDCPSAAKVVCTESGLWIRQNYPDLGVDLTNYSAKTEGKYGRSPPPAEYKAIGAKHLIRVATEIDGPEPYRDMTALGVGISTCGGEGFSSKRDENGVSKRSGSWSHALMGNLAVDDRPWAHETYGDMLILCPNSWGAQWISGPRDIYDSAKYVPAEKKAAWIAKGIVNSATGNILIPEGAFWARWSDWKRRSMVGLGGANGWPSKKLPDLGFDWA